MYTQKELESMSDQDLNYITSSLRHKYYSRVYSHGFIVQVCDEDSPIRNVDYCNNWSDCGDLVDELSVGNMSVFISEDSVSYNNHHKGEQEYQSEHTNTKRAVTIIYILIKQESL